MKSAKDLSSGASALNCSRARQWRGLSLPKCPVSRRLQVALWQFRSRAEPDNFTAGTKILVQLSRTDPCGRVKPVHAERFGDTKNYLWVGAVDLLVRLLAELAVFLLLLALGL